MGGINLHPEKRPAKYRAIPTDCEHGHRHASKIEARRCNELAEQQISGAISGLEQQPTFKVHVEGRAICSYIADFRYSMADSGLVIVEDVKGKATAVFNLKRKLVEATHPGTVITIWPPKKRKARRAKKA
jgi:hypothetical protein